MESRGQAFVMPRGTGVYLLQGGVQAESWLAPSVESQGREVVWTRYHRQELV